MYKIIQNNKVVDVVQVPSFIRFLATGHIAMTDKVSAQGVVGSDEKTIYSFMPVAGKDFKIVTLEEITESEFNRLKTLLNSDNATSVNNVALKAARQEKITKLSSECKTKIVAGFSVKLSDGNLYNFRLTTEDQLNLMLLENQLNSSLDTFIYHATNQPCRVFLREDMQKIIAAFRKHITYHTTYFNVTKQYINSLTSIYKINSFCYGDNVSYDIEDAAILKIIENGDRL
jgi:hypothetical protein